LKAPALLWALPGTADQSPSANTVSAKTSIWYLLTEDLHHQTL
jgi:hypothetical protein